MPSCRWRWASLRGARRPLVLAVCLGEAVLAPLWVFCALGEAPSRWTLGGGGLLLLTLVAHELVAVGGAKRPLLTAARAAPSDAQCDAPSGAPCRALSVSSTKRAAAPPHEVELSSTAATPSSQTGAESLSVGPR